MGDGNIDRGPLLLQSALSYRRRMSAPFGWGTRVGLMSLVCALAMACSPSVPSAPRSDATAADASASTDLASVDGAPADAATRDAAPPDAAHVDAAATDAPATLDRAETDDVSALDGPTPRDVALLDDVRPGDAGTADVVAPSRECLDDAPCASRGWHCDRAAGVCRQCVDDAHCGAEQVCSRGVCARAVSCTGASMCPGGACDTTLGRCVDCLAASDCGAGLLCAVGRCVTPPAPCVTTADCASRGQVCASGRACVDCVGDGDCATGQYCGPNARCLPRVCTPGAEECVDASHARACDARGTSWETTTCSASATCASGICVERACAPGAMACLDGVTRRTCAPDGARWIDVACASGEVCADGACRMASSGSGDTCATAVEVVPDGPPATVMSASVHLGVDVGLSCARTPTNNDYDAVWHFRLAAPRDVTITLSGGAANTAFQLLRWGCQPDSTPVGACLLTGGSTVRTYQALDAADYFIVAEWPPGFTGTISVTVSTDAPTPRDPGEVCATAVRVMPDGPPVTARSSVAGVDLGVACGTRQGVGTVTSARDVVFVYTLAEARDVTVLGRVTGASDVSIEVQPRCGEQRADLSRCTSEGTVQRPVFIPRQPPGTYYVVVENTNEVTVTVTTRPAGSVRSYTYAGPSESTFIDVCAAPGATRYTRSSSPFASLPFEFRFWNTSFPAGYNVYVDGSGYLSFDGVMTTSASRDMPSMSAPNGIVAVAWSSTFRASTYCVVTLGTAPNRRWIVEWDGQYGDFINPHDFNVEAVFFEGSGVIDIVHPRRVTTGLSMLIGLENLAGTDAAVWTNYMPVQNPSVRFTPTP